MWIAGSYIRSGFNLLEEPPYHHPPWWLDHFTFQRECTPAVYSGSLFSTPSPTLVISCLLCFPFGCAGSLLLCGPFLVAVSSSCSSLQCTRFSCSGFSCCRAQAVGARASVVAASFLVAPWHVESFRIRIQTCVPCIGRRIPIHCTTREVLSCLFGASHSSSCEVGEFLGYPVGRMQNFHHCGPNLNLFIYF